MPGYEIAEATAITQGIPSYRHGTRYSRRMSRLHEPTSMNLLVQIVAASLLGGLLSMMVAALLTLGLPRHWLTRMVSFSAGVLLATALLDLLPEALEGGYAPYSIFSWLLAGLLGFFVLEKTALWRHQHGDDGEHQHHAVGSAAPMIIIGDGVHNLTDGAVIAAAFLADTHVGWVTALAIIAHEIPQEAGSFALLLAAGWSKTRAFIWNGVASMTSVAGGVVAYFSLEGARAWVPPILSIAAASFIYIAVSDLMPWLRHQHGAFIWHGGFMAAGVALVPLGIRFIH
jgi:zinc and cadmium transporter